MFQYCNITSAREVLFWPFESQNYFGDQFGDSLCPVAVS
jgi:hypothetical protein